MKKLTLIVLATLVAFSSAFAQTPTPTYNDTLRTQRAQELANGIDSLMNYGTDNPTYDGMMGEIILTGEVLLNKINEVAAANYDYRLRMLRAELNGKFYYSKEAADKKARELLAKHSKIDDLMPDLYREQADKFWQTRRIAFNNSDSIDAMQDSLTVLKTTVAQHGKQITENRDIIEQNRAASKLLFHGFSMEHDGKYRSDVEKNVKEATKDLPKDQRNEIRKQQSREGQRQIIVDRARANSAWD